MAQKFVSLDDAARQLGVSKERLTQLREEGKIRGYRDGASWKFRSGDVDKLEETGPPQTSTASDIYLPMPGDLIGDDAADDDAADIGDIRLDDSIDLDDDDMEVANEAAAASDIGLEDLDEPTVPADISDDDAESVLLSENEFGDADDRPPSTIIGKVDLGPTSDLDLVVDTEDASSRDVGQSDVRLAMPDDDVLSSGIGPDDTSSGSKSAFSNIDELELDLEAESSRILSVDVTPGAGKKPPTAGSDLSLAASSSDAGLSGLSSLELDDDSIITGGDSSKGGTSDIGIGETPDPGLSGISALELEDDSDVLGEGDGSDITLSSQDSGINLIAPSDSGLALDDAPIELGGSAIGSSLDLGEIGDIDDVITLEADDADDGDGDDFLLTPISEEAIEGEDESSSQVIALDDVAEEEDAAAMLGGEDDMLGADFGTGGLAAAGMPASVGVTLDDPFPAWTVVLLAGCMFVLCLCGMMMVDLVRNIWSWNEPYSLNSGLIDAILGLFS